jgi:hypothetical protein
MTNTPLSRILAEAANLISNEDYQTRERDRQMANTGKLGSSVDSKEKASKKVYGKDGKVVAKNLNAFVKKANSPKNEDIEEAAKASPQEDEFLTDLTKAQIAAISPLLKSKDTNKLKAYLVSQKIVDKDFNDIQGYKMDRDVLSVLQRSFKDYHEQVENVEEAAEDASSPETMVRKFNKMTDVNDHTGAAILLATFLKDTKAMKCLKLVKQIHELENSMPSGIGEYRAKLSKQLWEVFSKKYPKVDQDMK